MPIFKDSLHLQIFLLPVFRNWKTTSLQQNMLSPLSKTFRFYYKNDAQKHVIKIITKHPFRIKSLHMKEKNKQTQKTKKKKKNNNNKKTKQKKNKNKKKKKKKKTTTLNVAYTDIAVRLYPNKLLKECLNNTNDIIAWLSKVCNHFYSIYLFIMVTCHGIQFLASKY